MGIAMALPRNRNAWVMFGTFCSQSAVLPWIRKCQRLALRAEDGEAYRHALVAEARVMALRERVAQDLWALEPEWCVDLPALSPWTPKEAEQWR